MMGWWRGAQAIVVAGYSIQGGRRVRILSRGCMTAAMATTWLAGVSGQAVAQSSNFDPTVTPQLNRVYAGCVLHSDTVESLQLDIRDGNGSVIQDPPEIGFVVVYALTKDNDGQPVLNGSNVVGHTGPVLCRNAGAVAIANTTQTTQIPASGTVDVKDVEDAFILRYENGGTTEKVICHTVDTNTDCFRISPSS